MSKTEYDLVLFGATSFVGRILARYLSEQYGTSGRELRWAAAGRSEERLAEVRDSLGSEAGSLPLIVANAKDEKSLDVMCARTQVVVTTVGPYALYGEPLVRACARSGTDYCDLAGEVQWIHRMITRYEDDARNSGARIVHCCGFDSIPSDMGVYFLQQKMQERYGQTATRVKMRVRAMRGGMSGGTVASLMNVVKQASRDPQLRRELANPYLLCPPDHGFSVPQPDVRSAQYDRDFNAWLAPFLMASVNTRVVLRSSALTGMYRDGDFRYDEATMTGRGIKGRIRAMTMSTGMGAFMLMAGMSPTRRLLQRFILPEPGEGPGPEAREKGFFDLRFLGRTAGGDTLRVKVKGNRDPGYGSTARMLGQAAACLAKDIDHSECPGGFWTPSTVFGDNLIERLHRYAGLHFEVLDQR